MPRILIADDHGVVRHGLIQILRDALPEADFGEAETGREAVEKVQRESRDLVILDISLPDQSGLQVLKQIRAIAPRLPVLILSMHPEEQFAVRAIRAGAAGYVTKRTAPQEIAVAARRVLAGHRYVTASIAERLVVEVGRTSDRPPHERLSDREYEVFRLLALGKTVKETAAELSLTVQTVSTYRARLLEKMGLETNAQLTEYLIQNRLFD
jgi:two-component system, NarL family, invasion response regulator UvrY